MIIKIKLGDLTARQMKAICDSYDCKACPLKIIGKKKECFLNFFCSPNAVLETEIEVSTDALNPEMAVSFEDELQKIRQWMTNAEFEYVRLKNTFWHLCHILGYWEGAFNKKALWWNIVKAFDPVKPDEPYEAKPKECVEDEEE